LTRGVESLGGKRSWKKTGKKLLEKKKTRSLNGPDSAPGQKSGAPCIGSGMRRPTGKWEVEARKAETPSEGREKN